MWPWRVRYCAQAKGVPVRALVRNATRGPSARSSPRRAASPASEPAFPSRSCLVARVSDIASGPLRRAPSAGRGCWHRAAASAQCVLLAVLAQALCDSDSSTCAAMAAAALPAAREVLLCNKCDASEGIFVGDVTLPATLARPAQSRPLAPRLCRVPALRSALARLTRS